MKINLFVKTRTSNTNLNQAQDKCNEEAMNI